MENLILRLEAEIGKEKIITNASDVRVSPENELYCCTCAVGDEAYEVRSGKVVSTIDGLSIDTIFPFINKEVMHKITAIRYAKVIQVAVGYKSWKGIPLKAFGGLVPSKEKEDILGILFPSTLFRNRAPEGGALLSVFIGGVKRPELFEYSDEDILAIVKDVLNEMLQCPYNPDLIRIFRYEKAIPQYETSTELRLFTIHEVEKTYPGLVLAGNMRDGVGISDRVKQAKQLADDIVAADNE